MPLDPSREILDALPQVGVLTLSAPELHEGTHDQDVDRHRAFAAKNPCVTESVPA
ncbi:MAG: hypothetical protein HY553_13410 [Elusimicrobia bacterium]|nr:hypothetical protein [Elusimicrobiota bacterium]